MSDRAGKANEALPAIVDGATAETVRSLPDVQPVVDVILGLTGIEYESLSDADQRIASRAVSNFGEDVVREFRNNLLGALLEHDPVDLTTGDGIEVLGGSLADDSDRGLFVATQLFGEVPGEAL